MFGEELSAFNWFHQACEKLGTSTSELLQYLSCKQHDKFLSHYVEFITTYCGDSNHETYPLCRFFSNDAMGDWSVKAYPLQTGIFVACIDSNIDLAKPIWKTKHLAPINQTTRVLAVEWATRIRKRLSCFLLYEKPLNQNLARHIEKCKKNISLIKLNPKIEKTEWLST